MVGESVPEALDQLRSRDALEGALGRPQSYAPYEEADMALQAAVLAHGIAETQPFIDGNKRTALIAMLTFLELNGFRVTACDPELAEWIIGFQSWRQPSGDGGADLGPFDPGRLTARRSPGAGEAKPCPEACPQLSNSDSL
jgi:death-on-curing family protein